MRSVLVPPFAPTLMESTRSIGYSIEAALADVIDNSISANAKRIGIDFFPIGEAYISILDDGMGMTSNELTAAMQYGSKNPREVRDVSDLGRYGLGLKTASLSQCRRLTVISKRNNAVSGCQWDIDHVIEAKDWSLILLETHEMEIIPSYQKLLSNKSGTLVVWQKLDKFATGETDINATFKRKIEAIREHLSLVFHRYLSGEIGIKKMEILMNERPIVAQDPFLLKKSTQVMDDEIIIVKREKVIVRPYILPHVSKLTEQELKALGGKEGLRKQQGFYVYRNKRLLVWGTWFRLMRQGELSKLARVQVDIPNSLDDLWTLDIKKSTAIPPEDVRINLANVITKIAESSKRTWTYRGKKEVSDNSVHMWDRLITRDNGIMYCVNRKHPLVTTMVSRAPDLKDSLAILLSQIESTLPLNSLYVDLTNDEKVRNETIYDDKSIKRLLKSILDTCQTREEKTILIDKLVLTDTFCEFQELIQMAVEHGELL